MCLPENGENADVFSIYLQALIFYYFGPNKSARKH